MFFSGPVGDCCFCLPVAGVLLCLGEGPDWREVGHQPKPPGWDLSAPVLTWKLPLHGKTQCLCGEQFDLVIHFIEEFIAISQCDLQVCTSQAWMTGLQVLSLNVAFVIPFCLYPVFCLCFTLSSSSRFSDFWTSSCGPVTVGSSLRRLHSTKTPTQQPPWRAESPALNWLREAPPLQSKPIAKVLGTDSVTLLGKKLKCRAKFKLFNH